MDEERGSEEADHTQHSSDTLGERNWEPEGIPLAMSLLSPSQGEAWPPCSFPPSQGQGEAALCLGEVRRAPEGMMPMRELLSISGFPPVSETSFYVDREEPVLDGLWPAHFLS